MREYDDNENEDEPTSRRFKFSRPFMIAAVLIVAGAGYLFWPRGGGEPEGVGQQYSLLTDETGNQATTDVHSGDVAIDQEVAPLVPEQPSQHGTDKQQFSAGSSEENEAAASETGRSEPDDSPTSLAGESRPVMKAAASGSVGQMLPGTEPSTPPATAPSSAPSKAPPSTSSRSSSATASDKPAKKPEPAPPPPSAFSAVQPQQDGPWAVQLGAFANHENALSLQAKLRGEGFDPVVRTANTTSGQLVYRVWIGYFASREQTTTFIRQNERTLGSAVPVHR